LEFSGVVILSLVVVNIVCMIRPCHVVDNVL